MTYLGFVLIAVAVAVINVCALIYAFVRVKHREPRTPDYVFGFLMAGPLFYLIDRQLRTRNHKLTKFEYYGLIFLGLVAMVIIVGSIVTNFDHYPKLN